MLLSLWFDVALKSAVSDWPHKMTFFELRYFADVQYTGGT